MHARSPKLLEDIRDAAAFIGEVTQSRTLAQYSADRLLRQGVERNFEIIGEAVKRLAQVDPDSAAHCAIPADHRLSQHPDPRLRPGGPCAGVEHRADTVAHAAAGCAGIAGAAPVSAGLRQVRRLLGAALRRLDSRR
jgi:hypothetical protein